MITFAPGSASSGSHGSPRGFGCPASSCMAPPGRPSPVALAMPASRSRSSEIRSLFDVQVDVEVDVSGELREGWKWIGD